MSIFDSIASSLKKANKKIWRGYTNFCYKTGKGLKTFGEKWGPNNKNNKEEGYS